MDIRVLMVVFFVRFLGVRLVFLVVFRFLR